MGRLTPRSYAVKNQFAVLFISVLAFVPCSSQGQGILNGGFELYAARSGFLANWHVRETGSPQTKNLSTTQNGVAGSTVPYRVKPEGFPGVSINPLEGLDEPLSFKEGQNYLHADGWMGRGRDGEFVPRGPCA